MSKDPDHVVIPFPGGADAARTQIARDHATLATLLERVGGVCDAEEGRPSDCSACGDGRRSGCCAALSETLGWLMSFMLEHFAYEESLMAALPRALPVDTHCARHRQEHVAFSTRYNEIVARRDASDIAGSIRRLEAFVVEWARSHALKYDAELDGLIAAHATGGA